ncbi:MAG: hypothetical protein MZV70_36135 [Desulfobacterales bacterium]|nr:hypothetical protein [Desulfobacterales bacterium]
MSTIAYEDIRRLEVEYEIPNSMTLTSKVYVYFDKDAQRTDSHTGVIAGSSTWISNYAAPFLDFSELGQRAKYFAVEFTTCGEPWRGSSRSTISRFTTRDRAHKGKVSGD